MKFATTLIAINPWFFNSPINPTSWLIYSLFSSEGRVLQASLGTGAPASKGGR
uniref:Uncharacterized protein n=1 Tax=Arundo donax TaxID=35708 RepID=A0A0A9T0P2_ARUDO